MSEKFSLRQPDYIDLGWSGWKLQPRDMHGRWSKSGGVGEAFQAKVKRDTLYPLASPTPKKKYGREFNKVEAGRNDTSSLPSLTVRSKSSHTEIRELDRGEVRKSLEMNSHEREVLFESAGLHTHYKESETELIQKWHNAEGHEKAKIEKEMLVRQKALSVALSTVKEAQTLAAREDKRNSLQKFDDHLKGSKVGKALLKIRDRLTTDRAFDTLDKAAEGAKEYGKDWATHLANSKLTGILVAGTVALASHYLGVHSPEELKTFLENPLVDAGAAAACGLALQFGLKMLHRGAKKAAPVVKKAPTVVKVKLRGA